METQQEYNTLYKVSGAFILLNALFLYLEVYAFVAIPLALAIVGIALFRLDWLLLLIFALVPASLTLEDLGMGMSLTMPTEPLLFGAMAAFFLRYFLTSNYDIKILKNPITISIIISLIWTFFAVLFSKLPMVSLKFFIAKLWFIVPFFFGGVLLFKNKKNIVRATWLFCVPMMGVIIYTLARQYVRGFDMHSAHWVMQPFFSDHTSYGAILAFFIPPMFTQIQKLNWHINTRILAGFVLGIFIIGTIMSYTRAAWVSLAASVGLYILIKIKIRWWVVVLGALTMVFIVIASWVPIMQKLEKNRQDSSGDLAEHVESMSNVATDASNLERLNRWNSAFRMFAENPVTGTGPGTYVFLYAPYQASADLTVISTNFGDLGNAHSEYFGPLAEQGVLGLVTWLIVILFIYVRGITTYYRLEDSQNKALLMGVILALTTYLTHGVLNNYLDIDKAAVPFWAFVAVIVAMDVYYERTPKELANSEQ